MSEGEARRRIEAIKEPYKLEILDGITERHPGSPITIYHVGSTETNSQDKNVWWDLCAGPHVEHTGEIDPLAIELESVAGESAHLCLCSCILGAMWLNESWLGLAIGLWPML